MLSFTALSTLWFEAKQIKIRLVKQLKHPLYRLALFLLFLGHLLLALLEARYMATWAR